MVLLVVSCGGRVQTSSRWKYWYAMSEFSKAGGREKHRRTESRGSVVYRQLKKLLYLGKGDNSRFRSLKKLPCVACYVRQFGENLNLQKQPVRQLYWNCTLAWLFSTKFTAYFQNTFPKEHHWAASFETNCREGLKGRLCKDEIWTEKMENSIK